MSTYYDFMVEAKYKDKGLSNPSRMSPNDA